ncbi:hypothetical protein PV369_41865, partial [Streptomyces scabiei]|uniref:phage major capsid protein n=1 Tax=Streptomyces scabiei TaxID=1930 RepID=UPI0029A20964
MTIRNFVPEIWSSRLLVATRKELVYASPTVVNRDYEGEIAEAGDTVRITSVSRPSIGTYVPGSTTITPEKLTTGQRTLLVDQSKYWAFSVDDVDKRQAKSNLIPAAMSEAAYNLADTIDQYVAGLYTQIQAANFLNLVGSPIDTYTTPTDAYNKVLVPLRTKLTKANVPKRGRYAVVPPEFYASLLLDERFIAADKAATDEGLRNGFVGRDEPLVEQQRGVELRRDDRVPAALGHVRLGQLRAQRHEDLVVGVRRGGVRVDRGADQVEEVRGLDLRVEAGHVLVDGVGEVVGGLAHRGGDEVGLRLPLVDVVDGERPVLRLVDQQRALAGGQLLRRDGRRAGHVGADRRAGHRGDADGVARLGDLALVVAVDDGGAGVDEFLAGRDEQPRAPDLGNEVPDRHGCASWLSAAHEVVELAVDTGLLDRLGAHGLEVLLAELLRPGRLARRATVAGALEPLRRCGCQVGLVLEEIVDRVLDLLAVDLAVLADLELSEVEEGQRVLRVVQAALGRGPDLGLEDPGVGAG